MTCSVTQASAVRKPGSTVWTGSSQPIELSFLVKAAATTVELIGFETDASWNTVSASTVPVVPTCRSPVPSR